MMTLCGVFSAQTLMDVHDVVQMSTDGGDREYSFQVAAQYFSE